MVPGFPDAQALPVEVVQHVQLPELAAIPQAIGHEVHGPGQVRRIRHGQSLGLLTLQPFAGLDPQVQFQRAIDAINTFVVPWMPLHVAQMQETQAEAPGLAGVRQPDQQISDLFILVLQLRAVAITGLAHPEGPAGQRDADLVSRHRFLGHLSASRWPRHFFPRASLSRSACMLRSAYILTCPPEVPSL